MDKCQSGMLGGGATGGLLGMFGGAGLAEQLVKLDLIASGAAGLKWGALVVGVLAGAVGGILTARATFCYEE